jgi:DNA-binding NarL/FixJ family response regulator
LGTPRRDVDGRFRNALHRFKPSQDPEVHAPPALTRSAFWHALPPRHRRITARAEAFGMSMEAGLRRLSLREARIARLVAEGLSDEQIAERLGIGVVDVSAELAEVFRKLGLRSRTELSLLAPERQTEPAREDPADA